MNHNLSGHSPKRLTIQYESLEVMDFHALGEDWIDNHITSQKLVGRFNRCNFQVLQTFYVLYLREKTTVKVNNAGHEFGEVDGCPVK